MTADPTVGRPAGRLIVVTDRSLSEAAGRPLVDTVAAIASAGAPLVLFREKDLSPSDRQTLGRTLASALKGTGTKLLVASDVALATELNAVGVHLASGDPKPRELADGSLGFGRSCHDTGEVAAAAGEGATWVTLSPIFSTGSKPDYGPALGTQVLGGHAVSVFALGGITPSDVETCVADGAHGVAVMGAIMSAPDPPAVVHQILEKLA